MLTIHNYIFLLICLILIAIDKVNKCISDIRTWMIENKLKINDSKTEFLVLTSSFLKQHFNALNISVGTSRIAPSIKIR